MVQAPSSAPVYNRHAGAMLQEALTDTPVVLLTGARQTGKSTMVQRLVPEANYYTFDDPGTLLVAQADPRGFLQSIGRPAVLDEIQLLPEIFRIIKLEVDRDRRPGQYILTGSANVLLLP